MMESKIKIIKLILACIIVLAATKSCFSFDFNVYIVTWNIASKFSSKVPLEPLLGLEKSPSKDKIQPEMYAIGFQELSFTPIVNNIRKDQWMHRLIEVLSIRDYVEVQTIQMQGLALVIFVKRMHLIHLHSIQAQHTGTGLGGFWGDKGAVSIRLDIYGNSVTFVNAHLAAHDNHLDKRVEDYKTIVQSMRYNVQGSKEILSHDYVFWFGDLNFRINEDYLPEPEKVLRAVQKGALEELIKHDQLLYVRNKYMAFHQFKESLPDFPPTFKFVEGTNDYNLKRRPAWCDRILYKINDQNMRDTQLNVFTNEYRSHPNYTISDHKPVSGQFTVLLQEEYLDTTVKFQMIDAWKLGAENTVKFMLPQNFKQHDGDWVGIFKYNFKSLSDHKAWQYVDNPSTVVFPANAVLKESNTYCFVYIHSTGTNRVFEVAGISAPFKVQK